MQEEEGHIVDCETFFFAGQTYLSRWWRSKGSEPGEWEAASSTGELKRTCFLCFVEQMLEPEVAATVTDMEEAGAGHLSRECDFSRR